MEIQPTHRRFLKGVQPVNLAKHLIEPKTFRIRRKPGKGAQTPEMTTDYQSASGWRRRNPPDVCHLPNIRVGIRSLKQYQLVRVCKPAAFKTQN